MRQKKLQITGKIIFAVVIVSIFIFSLAWNSLKTVRGSIFPSASESPDFSTLTPILPIKYSPKVEPQHISVSKQPVPSTLVIHFAPGSSDQEQTAYIKKIGGEVVQSIESIDSIVVHVPDSFQFEGLPEDSIVLNSEPDYLVSALETGVPSDPRYPEQWALPAIDAPTAWEELPENAPEFIIAVVDSGICLDHPDLIGRINSGWDFLENDTTPQDDFGHGCAVSGIIAANTNNGVGISGLAPNVQIMPIRVLDATGIGTYSNVAAGIIYAVDHGSQVINLSLGGTNPSSVLEAAIKYAVDNNVIVVAAAGNNGVEGVLYPAAYDGVIAVGSIDPDLYPSSFSNYGPQVDIWAPGRDVLTTQNDGSYALVSGTSFAVPYVAGAEAFSGYVDWQTFGGGNLLFSAQPKNTPTQTESASPTRTTNPTQSQTNTPTTPENSVQQAIQTAIENEGDSIAWPGTKLGLVENSVLTSGDWGIAYVNYLYLLNGLPTNEKPSLVLLHKINNEWKVIFRSYANASEYNKALDSLPEDLSKEIIIEDYYISEIITNQEYSLQKPWSTYGILLNNVHDGFAKDFFVGTQNTIGDQILAAADGYVEYVKEDSSDNTDNCYVDDMNCYKKANMVVINHGGYYTWYVHLKQWSVPVSKGDWVYAGKFIGQEGNTGYSSNPHLHFAVSDCAVQGTDMFWYTWCKNTYEFSFVGYDGTSANWSPGKQIGTDPGSGGVGGRVLDSEGVAAANVTISTNSSNVTTTTDKYGSYYLMSVPAVNTVIMARDIYDATGQTSIKVLKDASVQADDIHLTAYCSLDLNASGCTTPTSPPTPTGTPPPAGDGIQMCTGLNYGQPCTSYTYTSNDVCISLSSNVKSIKFVGSYYGNYDAVLSSKTSCSDQVGRYSTNVSDLGSWNDKILSFRIEKHASPPPPSTDGIQMCSGTNFGTPCTKYTYTSNDTCIQLSSNVQSVKFLGSYYGNYDAVLSSKTSCSDQVGRYSTDVSDLLAWKDKILSFRIEKHSPPVPPPSAVFDVWPLNGGIVPLSIQMHIVSMDNISSCTWNYNDGQTSNNCNQLHNHIYTSAGIYFPSLTVSGPGGQNSYTLPISITVNNPATPVPPPSAVFDIWPLNGGTAPLSIQMHIVSKANITDCIWDYGDGQTSTICDQNHDHTYSSAGTYIPSLIVNGPGGQASFTLPDPIIVKNLIPPPSAIFFAGPRSGNQPLSISLHIRDTSNITSCSWDYGDGQTGTFCAEQHNHLYENTGIYTISLTVSGPGGTDHWTLENYINVTEKEYYPIAVIGKPSGEPGLLKYPQNIVVDSNGNLYVLNTYTDRILMFSISGDLLLEWGGYGTEDGKFDGFGGIGIDPAGNVYVADWYNCRIQKFSSSGEFLTKWGTCGTGSDQFNYPSGVAADQYGNIYVSDWLNNQIKKFTQDGSYIRSWGSPGNGNGQFDRPNGVSVGQNNIIYVLDWGNSRVQMFDLYGSYLSQFGSYGSDLGQLNNPHGIAIDKEGNVFVADSLNGRIQKFTSSGTALTSVEGIGYEPGQFQYPWGIAVDEAGYVYVSDYELDIIQKFWKVGIPEPCYTLSIDYNYPNGGVVNTSPTPTCNDGTGYANGIPVHLSVTSNNGFTFNSWSGDETGDSDVLDLVMVKDKSISVNFDSVQLNSVYITDDLGPASLNSPNNEKANGVNTTAYKDAFYPGDPIQLHLDIFNDYATAQNVVAEWQVIGPAGRVVPELALIVNISTGSGGWHWWINKTIPDHLPKGQYTFIGKITYEGLTTTKSTNFSLVGPEAVEVYDVYATDVNGNIGSMEAKVRRAVASELTAKSIVTFNPGDPVRLLIEVSNDVADDEMASFSWVVIDPWGRFIRNLSWSGDLPSSLGISAWYLESAIPNNAIGGTYKYTGYITYGGRTTFQSQEIAVNGASGPVNDDYLTPITLTNYPYTYNSDTWGATVSSTDPISSCGSGKNSNSVWYKFTPTENGILHLDTLGSDYDTVVAVWTGSINNLNEEKCNDDHAGKAQSWVEVPVEAGIEYYIEVMDFDEPGGGGLILSVDFAQPISNDDFNSPITITDETYVSSLDTRAATKANDDPSLSECNRLPGQASVWYKFTPAISGLLELETAGSNYDTMLAVWTGTRGDLSSISCNDDVGIVNDSWDSTSYLSTNLIGGTTYYIEASTYAGKIDVNSLSSTEIERGITKNHEDGVSKELITIFDTEIGTKVDSQEDSGSNIEAQYFGGNLNLLLTYFPGPTIPALVRPTDSSTLSRTNNTLLEWTTTGINCVIHIWGGNIDISPSGDCSNLLLGEQRGGEYSWQVTANNEFGQSTGPIWNFKIQPFGVTSLQGTMVSPSQIKLTWTLSSDDPSDVDGYDIYLNNALVADVAAGVDEYVVSDISCNVSNTYFVRSRRQGVQSENSNTVNISIPCAPDNFKKANPSNGATSLTLSPTLIWLDSPYATSYEYCFDTTDDNVCDSWVPNDNDTSVVLSGLIEGIEYYWQVRAINGPFTTYADNGVWWSFIALNHYPTDAEKLTTSKVSFDWGDIPGATMYNIQLSGREDFSTTVFSTKTPDTFYTYDTPLKYSKTYYWRIRYKIGGFWSAWSTPWLFKSMDPLLQSKQISPMNRQSITESRTPEFSWNPVENAAYYKIQIGNSALFDVIIQKVKVPAGAEPMTYIAEILPNGKYYWRVRAIDGSGGKGPWSEVWIFKIAVQ